ncbi:MAG TPA: HEAT repeat domain-containing protein, partial [Candidatus Ozemobacteraceae bacterium]|nr:HEAT repeat domain-containing protein [Candidatus Ozemobacteraceae bacterium]
RELSRIVSAKRFGKLRLRAMRILGAYGKSAGKALPTLTRLLLDANAEMRLTAAETILDLFASNSRKLPDVIRQLQDPKSPLRQAAVQLLQTAAPLAHPAAPLLYEYLENGSIRPARAIGLLLPSTSLLRVFAEPLLEKADRVRLDPHAEATVEEESLENTIAVETDAAQADAADQALSFEDIPAQELE